MVKNLPAVGFPGGSDSKASARNAGDPGSILGSGRSPGEGNGNPLQYPCLENSTDRLWGHKELDTTERLAHTTVYKKKKERLHTKDWESGKS